jgi:integrase
MNFEIEVIDTGPTGKNTIISSRQSNKNYYDTEEISYFYFVEYSRLLKEAKKFYKLIYLFLFETGARIEEARAVKFKDLDLDTSKIKIKTMKQREAKKARILTISDTLKSIVLQHQIECNLGREDFIFAKIPGGKPITQQAVDLKMKADCQLFRIDREKGHCHTWRHSRAIQLLESGMDIRKLQLFLGHTTIQSTLVYLKYSNRDLNMAIVEGNRAVGLV